jgi:hypothetical protein
MEVSMYRYINECPQYTHLPYLPNLLSLGAERSLGSLVTLFWPLSLRTLALP